VIASLFANARSTWLRAGVVHVWRVACRQDPGALAAVLSEDERAAASRFVAREHRDAYVVQHAMVRALLARYLGIAPERIEFTRGRNGKPKVVASELEHNLSHADDVALLAIGQVAVGVDIERVDALADHRVLHRTVLAPDEVVATRHDFMRVWCRKEACLKATGVGLIDELTSVSVIADRVDIAGDIVHVQDLDMGTTHVAALATATPVARVASLELESVRVTS
jgi:4'-phosphopantetheinyl transferase